MPVLGIIASGQQLAAANSYESIATANGTGSSNTISFTSIPSTYKHLQVRILARNTVSAGTGMTSIRVNPNSDVTATNYAMHDLSGDGTTAAASGAANTFYSFRAAYLNGAAANLYGVAILDIMDYASTSKYKTMRTISGGNDNGVSESVIILSSGLWMSTSAITSLDLRIAANSFTTGSTIALYGIKG